VNIVSISALPLRLRSAAPAQAGLLSAGAAFALQVSIVVFLLAGSSAPTPLYVVYQAAWGFSPITVTVVFGVYALAVLTSLLTVGSLSDHIGRRPVLIVALLLQAATMLLFASAAGVPELMAARVVQGLSTGAAASALGAGLLDLHRARGTLANAVAPMAGTATGAIGSGLLVQYLPEPTHLVYLVLFVVFALQAVGVILMTETAARKPGALASLRPRLIVPVAARRPLFVTAPALVAIWALPGFYGSLGPALVRLVTGSSSLVCGGLALFVLAASGGLAVLLLRSASSRLMLLLGIGALLAGVACTMLAITQTAAVTFFVGATIAGIGFGASFQGVLRTVLPLAAPHERAGLLAIIYAVSYLALGVPAVLAGALVARGGSVLSVGLDYSLGVMVLAGLALLGLVLSARLPSASPAVTAVCPHAKPLAGPCQA
jgi:MFS family permease